MSVSILAVVFRRQILENRQFQVKFFDIFSEKDPHLPAPGNKLRTVIRKHL